MKRASSAFSDILLSNATYFELVSPVQQQHQRRFHAPACVRDVHEVAPSASVDFHRAGCRLRVRLLASVRRLGERARYKD
jgi:hypothetical protein